MGLWEFFRNLLRRLPQNSNDRILESPKAPPKEIPSPITLEPEAPWLTFAIGEIGVEEFEGEKNNPRVLEYFKATEYRPHFEDNWCSAFVCFCLEKTGHKSTRKANARSYEWFGTRLIKPKRGCIAVFWRGSKEGWQGHVGFYMGQNETHVYVLGGNQNDSVKVSSYPKNQLLSYRWP